MGDPSGKWKVKSRGKAADSRHLDRGRKRGLLGGVRYLNAVFIPEAVVMTPGAFFVAWGGRWLKALRSAAR